MQCRTIESSNPNKLSWERERNYENETQRDSSNKLPTPSITPAAQKTPVKFLAPPMHLHLLFFIQIGRGPALTEP